MAGCDHKGIDLESLKKEIEKSFGHIWPVYFINQGKTRLPDALGDYSMWDQEKNGGCSPKCPVNWAKALLLHPSGEERLDSKLNIKSLNIWFLSELQLNI